MKLNSRSLEEVAITTSGDSRLNLMGELDRLSLIIRDDSRVDSEARVREAKMSISTNGRFYGYDGRISKCDLTTSSEARARLNVSNYLEVDAGGFSSVRYKGSPRLEIKDKSSSAVVSQY